MFIVPTRIKGEGGGGIGGWRESSMRKNVFSWHFRRCRRGRRISKSESRKIPDRFFTWPSPRGLYWGFSYLGEIILSCLPYTMHMPQVGGAMRGVKPQLAPPLSLTSFAKLRAAQLAIGSEFERWCSVKSPREKLFFSSDWRKCLKRLNQSSSVFYFDQVSVNVLKLE